MVSQLTKRFHFKKSHGEQWLTLICGHPSVFDLEFQVLNWVLMMNAMMGVLLTAENIILHIPFPAAEATLGVTVFSLIGYYIVRIRKKFLRIIAPLIYAVFLLPTTFIWFDSAGLEGGVPYLYIVPILAGVSIMRGRTQMIVLSITVIHLFALIVIESICPQLVSPYPSEFARWLDTLIIIVYTVVYGLGYTSILMYNLEQRRELTEQLLLNILPKPIAERLKYAPNEIVAESHDYVTVLFADLVNFTAMSAQMSPVDLVNLLNKVFTEFDRVAEKYGIEKIKTIGDCYMVAGGVPLPRVDHAQAITQFALEIRNFVANNEFDGKKLDFRFGISSGPLVGGVIGQKKFAYDLWGDTVNTASRMESTGKANTIQITEETYRLIKDDFVCVSQEKIRVKGKGEIAVWYVESAK
ncbi:MAG TPA: adenylate/guanylate cyclase domain-containing protein [bacterium]|nr:adenylate/guanylate cyclase domain-containing protein [bacterium]